jgi:hypothetical protein
VLRKAAFLPLREDHLSVGDDVELARLSRHSLGVVSGASVQLGRETRSPAVIAVSDRAVEDLDLHGASLAKHVVVTPIPAQEYPQQSMSAFIITRIQTGDYDRWRPMFDQDRPLAREKATRQQVLRNVDDPNHVFIFLEFDSLADANEARDRLLQSGVLDRFEDKDGPNVLEEAP